jgi:NAD(P)-dependent dehydrogenase (short-subunit alcohol dehydrogenase family)
MSDDQEMITSPFGRHSTAMEVLTGVELAGKRALVTGATSGIGVETVRALAAAHCAVTLTARDRAAGQLVAEKIIADTGNSQISVVQVELTDRRSVAAAAKSWDGPLDILINNAGVMAEPLQRTPEGWEHQFATNHLGRFGLAVALHDALAAAKDARA